MPAAAPYGIGGPNVYGMYNEPVRHYDPFGQFAVPGEIPIPMYPMPYMHQYDPAQYAAYPYYPARGQWQ